MAPAVYGNQTAGNETKRLKRIKALHYHGLNENRASKDALALKGVEP